MEQRKRPSDSHSRVPIKAGSYRPRATKGGRTSRARKKTGGTGKMILVLLMMIAVCAGIYYFSGSIGKVKTPTEPDFTTIDKVELNGKDADYRKAATEVQQAIDQWLDNKKYDKKILETIDRESTRQATGGKYKWSTQKVVVTPSETFDESTLQQILNKSNGRIVLYNMEPDVYRDDKVMRYDLALKDTLDNQSINLIVCKLYVTAPIIKKSANTITDKINSLTQKTEKTMEKIQLSGRNKAKLAIVLDDFGYNGDIIDTINTIPEPLTYSVLPYKEYSTAAAESGHAAGRQIILHLPMQPLSGGSSEVVNISTEMGGQQISGITAKAIDSVPYVIGVNNHQGSRATTSRETMVSVLNVIKQRGIFFLDSRTNSTSIAKQTAGSMGVSTAANELFIDNDNDVDSIKERLRQAGKIALRDGSCIIIGHARPNTAEALRSMTAELENQGIEFVFVSQLMQ